MFKVGQFVVYPGHGVGLIKSSESKDIFGKKQKFLTILILENQMKIMIPEDNAEFVGVRSLISKNEIPEIFETLRKSPEVISEKSWFYRFRDYSELLNRGGIRDLATVLRSIVTVKADQELSFGERRTLERARALLVKELSLAMESPSEEVEKQINLALGVA